MASSFIEFISCSANSNDRWDDCPRTQKLDPDFLCTVPTSLRNFHFLNTPPRIYFNEFIPLPKLELYENALQRGNVFSNACFAFKLGRKTFQTLGVFSQLCVVKLKCVWAGDISAVFLAQTGKKYFIWPKYFLPFRTDKHSAKNCLIRGGQNFIPSHPAVFERKWNSFHILEATIMQQGTENGWNRLW